MILLLDAMGTVVAEPFVDAVPAFFGTSLADLVPQLSYEAWCAFECGDIDEDAFRRRFFRDGRDYDHAGLVATLRDAYRYVRGMEELLADLAAAGVDMHILSNYPPWYRMIEDKLRVSRYAAWSFVSCDTGLRKPDPEAFRYACRHLGASPADCVFVDDRADNCAAARDVGLRAIQFEGARALRASLAALPERPLAGA